jgi:DNA-nicking Smr family endonuclease
MSATKKIKLNSSLRDRQNQISWQNTNLKPDDELVWKNYIDKLYNTPEYKFRPKKGHDQNLKFSLDLHGMTVQQAFNATRQFLEEHRINGSRTAIIISGKGGKIADELPLWIANVEFIRKCEPIIDSTGEAGAYTIYFYAKR